MSRNSEYQFVSTDAEKLEALLIASYEKITKASVQPASPEKLFIQWITAIVLQERVMNNYTGNQNIPSRAEGENLDAMGELFYVAARPEAQSAVCTVRFYISEEQKTAVLIPAGTRVTDASSTLIWETAADAYVTIGETYVDVPVRCQTPGVIGNGYAAGQINTAVDLYDYYSGCENITVSDDGADRATDDEYYELMRASMDSYSTAGPMGAYVYHAKRVSTEIADVKAVRPAETVRATLDLYELAGSKYAFLGGDRLKDGTLKVYPAGGGEAAASPGDYTADYAGGLLRIAVTGDGALAGAEQVDVEIESVKAGHVYIYVLMDDGTIATTETKNAVLAACSEDTARPLTDRVEVRDPETVRYDIAFTYYIPRGTAASSLEIQAAVNDAIQEYVSWQCGKIGRDINPSKLHGLLMRTGVKRVELTSPPFTALRDGTDNTVPQIAAVGTITATNGGYEDE